MTRATFHIEHTHKFIMQFRFHNKSTIIDASETNGNDIFWLSALCIISNLSYYPTLQASSYARIVVISMWVLYLAIVFVKYAFNTKWQNQTVRSIITLYVIFLLHSAIGFFCGNIGVFTNHFFGDVSTAFAIFLASFLVGHHISADKCEFIGIIYGYVTGFLAIPLFVYYLYGSNINTSIYDYAYGKNEIAVLLACSIIFC